MYMSRNAISVEDHTHTCLVAGKICHKCGKHKQFARYCTRKTQQEPQRTQPFEKHLRPINATSLDTVQSDSDSYFDYIYAVKHKEIPSTTVTASL